MRKAAYKQVVGATVGMVLLSSCGARVKSFPYSEASNAGVGVTKSKGLRERTALGFTYGLPKTIFEITGVCSLYRQIFYSRQSDGSLEPSSVLFLANLDEGLNVKPIGVADPSLRFRVDPKVLRNWRVHTEKAKFTISDDGLLTQMNSTFDDRTAEIIESTSKTAINVAKTMAIAGASDALVPGLIEKVGTFTISSKADPESFNLAQKTIDLFPEFGARTLTEATANLVKDEMREAFIPDQMTVVANKVTLSVDRTPSHRTTKTADIETALPKDNFGNKLIRFISFENLAQNYIDGLVTRIPAYIDVAVSCEPLIVREPKEKANSPLDFTGQIKKQDDAISKLQKSLSERMTDEKRNQIQVDISEHVQVREAIADFDKEFHSTRVLFGGTVPVAQFGRLAVIPVHSNTFVKQTKNITVNKENGRITDYDFSATSSGERAAKMLENISKSVVDELPNLLKAGGAAKTDAK